VSERMSSVGALASQVSCACVVSLSAALPALAGADRDDYRTTAIGVPAVECKVAEDDFLRIYGTRMWWEKDLPRYPRTIVVGAAGELPDGGRKAAMPASQSRDVSSPQSTAPQLEPVLISNVPELARVLPDPVELPPVTAARSAFNLAKRAWKDQDERFVLEQHLLKLRSWAAVVVNQNDGRLLYAKNADSLRPIASITKVMTAMVVLDSGAPLEEELTIEAADIDTLKGSSSRLRVGTRLTRGEMLKLMLMSSENRAAHALARSYQTGAQAFVEAMNEKARVLGMEDTRFLDPTGLNPANRSTAYDLAVMVNSAHQYPLIREFTTSSEHSVELGGGRHRRELEFHNSNGLVGSERWDIGLSKTGYISEAGRCLVLQATIAAKPVIIVLLDSWGTFSRIADANRIKRWIEELGRATSGAREM
jgi:serine-type D-Ala-D-Ala endopeptidase (penicillin-binding protein 7)